MDTEPNGLTEANKPTDIVTDPLGNPNKLTVFGLYDSHLNPEENADLAKAPPGKRTDRYEVARRILDPNRLKYRAAHHRDTFNRAQANILELISKHDFATDGPVIMVYGGDQQDFVERNEDITAMQQEIEAFRGELVKAAIRENPALAYEQVEKQIFVAALAGNHDFNYKATTSETFKTWYETFPHSQFSQVVTSSTGSYTILALDTEVHSAERKKWLNSLPYWEYVSALAVQRKQEKIQEELIAQTKKTGHPIILLSHRNMPRDFIEKHPIELHIKGHTHLPRETPNFVPGPRSLVAGGPEFTVLFSPIAGLPTLFLELSPVAVEVGFGPEVKYKKI